MPTQPIANWRDILKYLNPFQSLDSSRALEQRLGIAGAIGSVTNAHPAPTGPTLAPLDPFANHPDLAAGRAWAEQVANAPAETAAGDWTAIPRAFIDSITMFGEDPMSAMRRAGSGARPRTLARVNPRSRGIRVNSPTFVGANTFELRPAGRGPAARPTPEALPVRVRRFENLPVPTSPVSAEGLFTTPMSDVSIYSRRPYRFTGEVPQDAKVLLVPRLLAPDQVAQATEHALYGGFPSSQVIYGLAGEGNQGLGVFKQGALKMAKHLETQFGNDLTLPHDRLKLALTNTSLFPEFLADMMAAQLVRQHGFDAYYRPDRHNVGDGHGEYVAVTDKGINNYKLDQRYVEQRQLLNESTPLDRFLYEREMKRSSINPNYATAKELQRLGVLWTDVTDFMRDYNDLQQRQNPALPNVSYANTLIHLPGLTRKPLTALPTRFGRPPKFAPSRLPIAPVLEVTPRIAPPNALSAPELSMTGLPLSNMPERFAAERRLGPAYTYVRDPLNPWWLPEHD